MQMYNVKKLHLRQISAEYLSKTKSRITVETQLQCRIGSFAKDCLQPLVNRI